jgi:5-deoxy-glucuronate isomerase
MNGVIHSRAGELVNLDITPESAGWGYSGLRTITLAPGESYTYECSGVEVLVIPLAGSFTVDVDGTCYELAGRDNPFHRVPDVMYAPLGSQVILTSLAGGRCALASARAENVFPVRHIRSADIPLEMRGAGNSSRQVVNYAVPGFLDADRIIACEVLTPAGNWSSYPPHKHDEESATESVLEEIYYFEVAEGPQGPGMAFQRVYGSPDRPIDICAEVRTGDAVLIPHGWHGPSMAVPGYDLYYLNVMAGPGAERAWKICDDPAHGWVRETWADEVVDPRLPLIEGVKQ